MTSKFVRAWEAYCRDTTKRTCGKCGVEVPHGAWVKQIKTARMLHSAAVEKPICMDCFQEDERERHFGIYQEEECIPPLIIFGFPRSGSSLLGDLLTLSGVHMGLRSFSAEFHEDLWLVDLCSQATIQASGGIDHQFPESLPDFEAVDEWVRENGKPFIEARRRPFPWGFKYPTAHWGTCGWLDLCPGAKGLLVVRDFEGWKRSYQKLTKQTDLVYERTYESCGISADRIADIARVMIVCYEELLSDPEEVLQRIAEHTGLPQVAGLADWIRRG